jgi:hypothetical protein
LDRSGSHGIEIEPLQPHFAQLPNTRPIDLKDGGRGASVLN